MTQGERIKKIRTFRKMTQKELGLKCGFPEKSADVRIRQYESNTKIPRKDTLQSLADALKVNYRSLQNYDLGSAEDILETLFWLDESSVINLFGFEKEYDTNSEWIYRGKYNDNNYMDSNPPIGITINYNIVNDFMREWLIRYKEYESHEISYEEYFEWKLNWPLSCDESKGDEEYVKWRKA